jgi:hypothetical protein
MRVEYTFTLIGVPSTRSTSNASRLRISASTNAVAMAGRSNGMVMRRSVVIVRAPDMSAASSNEASSWRSVGPRRMTMTGTVVSARCTQMMPGIE